jgi:hypothetical protein
MIAARPAETRLQFLQNELLQLKRVDIAKPGISKRTAIKAAVTVVIILIDLAVRSLR